jgi:HK97 family phage portal protein
MATFRQKLGVYTNSVAKRLYGIGQENETSSIVLSQQFGYVEQSGINAFTGTVYDCVNLISEVVSQYEPEIYIGDNPEEEETHEIVQLINNPQKNTRAGIRGSELLYGTEAFILLCGEAFWYLPKGVQTGKPKEIILLNPNKMGVAINKATGEVTGYFTKKNGRPDIPFEVEEIIHLKTFNPHDAYRGLSVVKTHLDEIATDDFSGKFTKNFFKNNAGISGVLSLQGNITSEAFKRFTRQWRQKYEGVDNAGKTALLRATDATFTKVGLGLDEIDMAALKTMTKDDILQAFRVPLPLLGKAEGVGLNQGSVDALEYVFAKYNIEPKLAMLDSALQIMADRYWPDQKIKIEHESTIPENKEFEQKQTMEFLNTVKTINEVRADQHLDPIPDGDTIYVPSNLLPLGETKPPVQEKSIKLKKLVTITKSQVKSELSTETKENFRLSLMKNQLKYERSFKRAIAPVLKAQQEEVLNNLEAFASKANDVKHFDDAEADKSFVEAILPIMLKLFIAQGIIALAFADDSGAEFKVTDALKAETASSVSRMARNFNDETITALNETINAGVQAGDNLADLKKRVEATYKETKGYRAERIARTETLKASNRATVNAYKQTGYVTGKQWYANPGACPICESVDGKVVSLDTNFANVGQSISYTETNAEGEEVSKEYPVSYEDIGTPPLHPQCECCVIPFTEEVN